MTGIQQFLNITEASRRDSAVISNLDALGLPANTRRLRVLWMYPDTLSLHGGRGDLMALLRFSIHAGLPLEIRRVEQPGDPIPFGEADLLWFCCGDLDCAAALIHALEPVKPELEAFAAAGKMIFANGSTGVILARELHLANGTILSGLGLLDMVWAQRETVRGNDLWMDVLDGIEVIGNEIDRADVILGPHQAPFGTVRYGGGNRGDGFEGAVSGNVIFTCCLGPLLVRNPHLALELLKRAALAAGISTEGMNFSLTAEDIPTETAGMEAARVFIREKMTK